MTTESVCQQKSKRIIKTRVLTSAASYPSQCMTGDQRPLLLPTQRLCFLRKVSRECGHFRRRHLQSPVAQALNPTTSHCAAALIVPPALFAFAASLCIRPTCSARIRNVHT